MRIQHNIMAMNAYRNFSTNTSALSKNLEKLSSGYKINRAGDDAAGLAISEKMRAQITGLKTAQKNSKDGISLIQTAEGALTEVHDMLNRMVELADQSANGTYDNETDRANLQKEFDALRTEIDRIADASNFNGIKLLDGSLGGAVVKSYKAGELTTPATDTVPQPTVSDAQNYGSVDKALTIDMKLSSVKAGTTVTIVDRSINFVAGSTAQNSVAAMADGDPTYKGVTVGEDGKTLTVDMSKYADQKEMYADIAKAINNTGGVSIAGQTFKVDADTTEVGKLTLTSAEAGEKDEAGNVTWTEVKGDAAAETMKNAETGAISSADDLNKAVKAAIKAETTPKVETPVTSGIFTVSSTPKIGTAAAASVAEVVEIDIAGTTALAVGDKITLDGKVYKLVATGVSPASNEIKVGTKDDGLAGTLKNIGDKLAGANYTATVAGAASSGFKLTFTATTAGAIATDAKLPANIGIVGASATVETINYTAGGGGTWSSLTIDLTKASLTEGTVITLGGKDFVLAGSTAQARAENLLTAIKADATLGGGLSASATKTKASDGVITLTNSATGANTVISDITSPGANSLTYRGISKSFTGVTAKEGAAAVPASAGSVEITIDPTKIKDGSSLMIDGKKYTFTAATTPPKDTSDEYFVSIKDIDLAASGAAKAVASAMASAIGRRTGEDSSDHTVTAAVSEGGALVLTEATGKEGTFANNTAWSNVISDADTSSSEAQAQYAVMGMADSGVSALEDTSPADGEATVEDTDGAGSATISFNAQPKVGSTVVIGEGSNAQVFEFVKASGDTLKNTGAIAVVIGKDLDTTIDNLDKAFKDNEANFKDVSIEYDATKKHFVVTNTTDASTDKTANNAAPAVKSTGGGLTLQIGEDSSSYNQLVVSVADMHSEALGLATASIADQDSAAEAVDLIKKAINQVSSTRGDLGALQNRLEHTINNLSVMQENIQDAESTIRDTDVAEEMMAYTKNNILIQSAQAMLAQANQVPQGVLQLLQ